MCILGCWDLDDLVIQALRPFQAAKKDQSEDERAKQIRTGERARSEDHEDD